MDVAQILPEHYWSIVREAIKAKTPIIVTGDRTKPTGKSTLCEWLRSSGAVAYEEWELEEGSVQPDSVKDQNSAVVVIRLNRPMFT